MLFVLYLDGKKEQIMANLKNILFGTMLGAGVMTGMSGCSSKDKEPKDDDKQKTEIATEKQKYRYFKNFMQPMTPQIMLETILVEGVELDDKGLCKPYLDSKGIWTIGFGLTVLDGKSVTENTRHITVQEAWEKSVKFYEDKETYFLMWCYEIGMDGWNIDTRGKALCLASVIYNSGCNLMEDPNDKEYCCKRNAKLRELYKQYGDSVTVSQVKELFTTYPIKHPRSFGRAVDNGNSEDWANALGGFTPTSEGGGIKWRRWLEGQMAMGNIAPKDLLDLPMKSMYDFWCIIGKQKSALFTKQQDGTWKTNPDGLKAFQEWSKNPVTKDGEKNSNKTLRDVLNSIDSNLVSQVEKGYCSSTQNTYTVSFEKTCDSQNDASFIAYNNGEYEKALDAGKDALKLAETNKQRGAANYNIGMAYLALGKYNKAVHYLEQSLAYNETNAAKEALSDAQQKRDDRRAHRGKVARGFMIGTGAVGLAAYGRKKYIAQSRQR